MAVTNVWDALTEFKKIANASKSIQAEFQGWGNKVIQFIVKAGEDCSLIIREGRLALEKGRKESPDLMFEALDGNLVNLITGQTDYTSLDILGSIKYEGNESDKNKFVAVIGLFIDALLGEDDEFEEFEDL